MFDQQAPVIADGGLASELTAQGHDLSGSLWSAGLLVDEPAAVQQAHEAFYRAGARIATSASYQASFIGFAARGIGRAESVRLLRRSVDLARAAAEVVTGEDPDGGQRWVVASVGPYGAALGNGAEYRGRYRLTVTELAAWHRPRMEVLALAGPDALACETVPDLDEGEALARVVGEIGVPAYLSYTISGERTRAGQPLRDAFAVAAGVDAIRAVGVNCCDPDDVAGAIRIAAEVTGKPVFVAPNSGQSYDGTNWVGTPRPPAKYARAWVAAGARILGGCCQITPADIADLAAELATGP